jgi:hypothetical protein
MPKRIAFFNKSASFASFLIFAMVGTRVRRAFTYRL